MTTPETFFSPQLAPRPAVAPVRLNASPATCSSAHVVEGHRRAVERLRGSLRSRRPHGLAPACRASSSLVGLTGVCVVQFDGQPARALMPGEAIRIPSASDTGTEQGAGSPRAIWRSTRRARPAWGDGRRTRGVRAGRRRGGRVTEEQRVADLTELLTRLGATDPGAWARSEVEEDIPQVARFLFLRQAWQHIVADGDTTWIEAWRDLAAQSPGRTVRRDRPRARAPARRRRAPGGHRDRRSGHAVQHPLRPVLPARRSRGRRARGGRARLGAGGDRRGGHGRPPHRRAARVAAGDRSERPRDAGRPREAEPCPVSRRRSFGSDS